MMVNIGPRFINEIDGDAIVQIAYCQNCGAEVTRRRFSKDTTDEQAHANAAEDGEQFLAHLEMHYPKFGEAN